MKLLLVLLAAPLLAQQYDAVLANGRVIDPESGLDAIRNVGIRGREIAAVSASPLQGKIVVDAKGLVVAPGFIDLHSHGQTPENYRFKAFDGVTTALEMEVGVSPVEAWYAERKGAALVNYGATVGHIPIVMRILHDTGTFLPRDIATSRAVTPAELKQVEAQMTQGLKEGALGFGFGIAYLPKTPREQIFELLALAAREKVGSFLHLRYGSAVEPDAIDSVQEVIADAAATGAAVHIVHITSIAARQTPACLRLIQGARDRGVHVTTEAYPYTASQTRIDSAIFRDGWQERAEIGYHELQWVATGERLTEESFARYRKQGGSVIMHKIPEETVREAMASPLVMIASDGGLTEGKGHPRGAGSFARVLGLYVREQKVMPLADAIRKMSYMPAQVLEGYVPAMRKKGRIKPGADADITVFDPARVKDKATFENPAQYSEGMEHVLVNGVFVLKDGALVKGVLPGKAVRR
jgi:N-acyl-D-aspartate/D-glutamate deacylase